MISYRAGSEALFSNYLLSDDLFLDSLISDGKPLQLKFMAAKGLILGVPLGRNVGVGNAFTAFERCDLRHIFIA